MEGQCSRDLDAWQSRLLEALREDVGEAEDQAAESEETAHRVEVLAFEVAGELFGVDIREMSEILLPRPTTPLPRTPAFIVGVLTLRGTVLPVIDLARRLGLPERDRTRTARIVVLRDGDECLGFLVDQVRGVVRFTDREVESSDYAAAVDPRFLKGIGYDREDNLVGMLASQSLCDFTLEEK